MTRRAWARLAIAIVVGLAEPPLELAWRCRAGFEASEACVWGKSLLPLARIVAPVVIIPTTLVILLLAEWLWTNAKARVRRER
jgi:hypothetical protein